MTKSSKANIFLLIWFTGIFFEILGRGGREGKGEKNKNKIKSLKLVSR